MRGGPPSGTYNFSLFKFIWDIRLHWTSCLCCWFLEHICPNSPNKKHNFPYWLEKYWVNFFKESRRLDWRMFLSREWCPVLFLVATKQSLISCAVPSPGQLKSTTAARWERMELEGWVWSLSYHTWACECILFPESQLPHLQTGKIRLVFPKPIYFPLKELRVVHLYHGNNIYLVKYMWATLA